MLDVYKDYYKLTDVPFRLSPDHRYSFEHPSYAQAKAYLEYAISQGEGFITITGLPGTGKTTLISEILAEVDKSHIRVATVTSTQLDARDFLHMVAASFGLQFGEENKVTLLRALTHFLVQQHRQGLRCVLIVDEAQGLSASALEELRLLANLQHRNKLVLQVCLVGQEQLREVIAAPKMEHLRQRLIASAHLDPLDLDETITYIEHRLVCAGWQGDPAFSEAALRHIYRSSGGIPRRINLICNRMFLHGGLEQQHELGGEDARLMVNELREEMLLAPGEAVSAGGADDPGEKTDDSVRRLPRGEMLAAREAHARAESLQQAVEQPAAVKADPADGVSVAIPPETVSRAQPEGPTTHPTPALADSADGGASATPPEKMPLAQPEGPTTHPTPVLADSSGGRAAATPPGEIPLAQPHGPTTQPAQAGARARARAGEALRPAPGEPPNKPKGGCLRVVVRVMMALLFAAFIAFMLSMALQKNWFALLKQEQGSHDALRPDTPSVVKSPRATTPREITTPPLPIKRKPRAGTASSKREPYKDENRRAGAAPAELTPKAKPVADKVKKTPTIQPVDAAIAPPPPPATKTGVVTAPPPAAAKQIAPAAKSPAAVAKKVAPAAKPPAAIEAQRPPLQNQAHPGVERPATRAAQSPARAAKPAAQSPAKAAKPAAQSPAKAAKPAAQSPTEATAPARQGTGVAPAPASPPQPTAVLTQPAITADDIKTALLSGRWNRNGQPASVLPSEVTFCRSDQLVINCWSVPQRSANSEGKAAYKVESTLSNFADTGEFHMLDRRLVRPLGADATNDERWHAAEHEMQCKMVKPDTVVCQDRYGNTNDYHLSVLSR